jgi:hypothetical protein
MSRRKSKTSAFGNAGFDWYLKNTARIALKEIRFLRFLAATELLQPVVITFEPRSGSTWLIEMLAGLSNTVVVQDPLIERNGFAYAKLYGFELRPLYFTASEMEEAADYLDDVFALRRGGSVNFDSAGMGASTVSVVSKWANTPWVSAWYANRYGARNLYLLRHPLNTIKSQMNFFRTQENLAYCVAHSEVRKRLPGEALELCETVLASGNEFQRRMLTLFIRWFPLIEKDDSAVSIIRYEDLANGDFAGLEFLSAMDPNWSAKLAARSSIRSRSSAQSRKTKEPLTMSEQEQKAFYERAITLFGAETFLKHNGYL